MNTQNNTASSQNNHSVNTGNMTTDLNNNLNALEMDTQVPPQPTQQKNKSGEPKDG